MEKLEYARTHTGSLLFDRTADIKITTFGTTSRIYYKLFDGMKDNMAGWIEAKPDNFLELDLTKVNPTFKKVVFCGYLVEGIDLKLRVNGELVEPAIADTKVEEYAKTFYLAENVSPEAIRFEFHGVRSELYEIEVF